MRKLIPSLILAVALVGLGTTPALAGGKAAEPVVSCGGLSLPKIDLPRLDLPSVCDLKAHIGDLALKLDLSVKASLSVVVRLAAQIGLGINATINLLLSLPTLIAKLLCL